MAGIPLPTWKVKLDLDVPGILVWMPVEGDVQVFENVRSEGEKARLADYIFWSRPDVGAIALAAKAAAERRTFTEIIETLAALGPEGDE